MAPAHAPLSSSSAEELLKLPDMALTYSTPVACASANLAPESELRELLLPSGGFHGRLQVAKSERSASKSGCELRVELTTDDDEADKKKKKEEDPFEVATALDANVVALDKNAYLRGVIGWKDLTLEKLALQVANKRYEVVLNHSSQDKQVSVASEMKLYGSKCSPQLLDEELVARQVVPSGVDAGALKIRKSDDVAVAEGHELDCAAVLDVTARAPLLVAGRMEDAMSYLRAFDANLDDTFEVSAKKRMVATVQLYVAPRVASLDTALLTQDAAATSYSSYNAPTKEMTFGILSGFFGLVAMLVAVAMKKKSHEKHCEAKHRNASQAAQLRRVSIRMASPSSASAKASGVTSAAFASSSFSARHRALDDFAHESEEEKEYEEYGEDDGLL
jgi:hypothetical protein